MKAVVVAILTVLVTCCFARSASAQDVRSDSSNRAWTSWKPYQADTIAKHTKRAKVRKMIAKKGKDSAGMRSAGFLSPDRYFEKYRAWSPYVYAADNPLRYSDPSGDTIVVHNCGGNHDLITPIKEIAQTQRGQDVVSFLQDMPQLVSVKYESIPTQYVNGTPVTPIGATSPLSDGRGGVSGIVIRIDPGRSSNLSADQVRKIMAEEVFHAYQYSHNPQEALKQAEADRSVDYQQQRMEVTAKAAANQMMDQFIMLRNSGQIDNSQIFLGTAQEPQ